ncbi:Nuclear-interacting partner of ALK [Arachis hypogaea]|nr:Nuclear-interacting partner of ALK [Arachis hypogaea]
MNEDGITSANPNSSLPKPPSSSPTPAASSAGASWPAVPANVADGEGRQNESDLAAAAGFSSDSNLSCRPWERGDLLRRLSTFKHAGKMPKIAGSLACAKRGWVNLDVAKIECEVCHAQLDFASSSANAFEADGSNEELSKQLDRAHKATCPWRGNSCPESLVQFPPTSPSALIGGYKDRCDGLLQFYSLPVVSPAAGEHMRVTHNSQIDRFLAQSQSQTAGEIGYRESASGMGFAGEQALRSYSYAQKLISLCGWEPRWLPNVLDCEEQSAESAKNGCSSGPAKGSAPSKKEFSTSWIDAGDNDALGSEFNCESRSPLLDCSLCGATVRVWDFLLVPRPVHLAPCVIDTPQTSKKMASTRGISAASGINEWAAVDAVEKEPFGDHDEATTSDKRQLLYNKSLDLNLKMASGPSGSLINLTSTLEHVQDTSEGRDLMAGRPSGSEVGGRSGSYEPQGPNARKRKLDDGVTTSSKPQQVGSAERTIIDGDNNEVTGGQQHSAGPFKRARDVTHSEAFLIPPRKPSRSLPNHSLDVQIEGDANMVNEANPERDHIVGNPSTRDSTHASSIIAMNTVYHSSDEESMESVDNCPVDVNDVNFPSVDLNETSELNSSYQGQKSGCLQPLLERTGGETGVSSSNACEVLNTEILTAQARDGPSFGISGGSVGMGTSHETEIHGTDISVHRGDSLGDVEPIAEVIENQGQDAEFVRSNGLIVDFVPEEASKGDPQGDSQAVVSQSTPRTDSGSKILVLTKVESIESGEKTNSSLQMLGHENGAHPSLSCNAIMCSAYEVSKEEVTQNGKDDGACHESSSLLADVVGTPYRENINGGVEFDPIKLHNDCCPWVNGDVAAAGCHNPTSSSGLGTIALCGWQLTLEALDSFQSLGHLPVQTLESESAASMCKVCSGCLSQYCP